MSGTSLTGQWIFVTSLLIGSPNGSVSAKDFSNMEPSIRSGWEVRVFFTGREEAISEGIEYWFYGYVPLSARYAALKKIAADLLLHSLATC